MRKAKYGDNFPWGIKLGSHHMKWGGVFVEDDPVEDELFSADQEDTMLLSADTSVAGEPELEYTEARF